MRVTSTAGGAFDGIAACATAPGLGRPNSGSSKSLDSRNARASLAPDRERVEAVGNLFGRPRRALSKVRGGLQRAFWLVGER